MPATEKLRRMEAPQCNPGPDYFKEWMQMVTVPRAALLVDDSTDETELIVQMSRGFNVQWEVCYTGEMALDKLGYKKYQLIVLDLNLGKPPHGVELFRQIKKVCPMCPVLILSGHISNEVIIQVTSVGFAMFAQKPTVFDSNFFEQLFMALNIPRVGEQERPDVRVLGGGDQI